MGRVAPRMIPYRQRRNQRIRRDYSGYIRNKYQNRQRRNQRLGNDNKISLSITHSN